MAKSYLKNVMTVVFLLVGAFLYSQSLQVTSPNGGETWLIGSSHDITWTSSGGVGNVRIEYSSDNGSNWTDIAASTENDGSYNWTTPGVSSTNYLVRVSETDGDPTDVSDAVFTVCEGISGRLTDPSGNGIPNVTVISGSQELGVLGSGVSDANGDYAVPMPVGNWIVIFDTSTAGNYVAEIYNDRTFIGNADLVTVTAGQTTTGIDEQLAIGGIVSGRVTDSSGNGIANVNVNVDLPDNDIEPEYLTGADGYYTIQGITPGNFQVQFDCEPAGYYVTEWYNDKHFREDAQYLYVTAGQTLADIDAQLALGSIIAGRVIDGSSSGIQGAEIRILNSDNVVVDKAWTEADGTYSTSENKTPSGNYKIYCVPPGPEAYIREYYNNKTTFETADTVTLIAGQTSSGIDFQLDTGGVISGRVTNSSANGIANVNVEVYDTDDKWITSRATDANGDYRVPCLQTGNYKVRFETNSAGNYFEEWYNDKTEFGTADIIAVTYGQTVSNIDAVLAASSVISGRVTNSGGNGVQDVRVRCYKPPLGNFLTAVTDANGDYTLQPVKNPNNWIKFDTQYVNGNYITDWYNHKMERSVADPVNVTGGQTVTLNYSLTSGGIITGRVTDPGGNGIADVWVRALNAYNGEAVVSVFTDGNGDYTLQRLPGGSYRIYFNTDNTSVSYVPEYYNNKQDLRSGDIIAITPGQTISGVNAVLTAGASISGRITDASTGSPIPDIEIYALDANGTGVGCYSYTDANGDYILKGLPAGNFKINFNSYYYNLYNQGLYNDQWYDEKTTFDSADFLSLTAGQTISGIDAALTGTGGIIRGRVTEETNGWPVEGIRVWVMKGFGEFSQWEGRTNANGDYQVTGIPTGQYKVMFYNTLNWSNLLIEVYNDKIFKGGYPMAGDWVTVTEGQVTGGINAVLSRGGTVDGRVTDASGNGIQGITVRLYEADTGDYLGLTRSWTDYYGYYSIPRVRPGQLKAFFTSVEQAGGQYKAVYYNGKNSMTSADDFTVQADDFITDINAVMTQGAGGTISGYARDQNREPITNAVVVAYNPISSDSYLTGTNTNSSGYFEIKGLIPGSYKIYSNSGWFIFPHEWYNEKPNHAAADIVTVVEGGNTRIEIILNDSYSLTLTSPNGGESWQVGTMQPITWTNTGPVGNVKLEYSTDNGSSWTDIVSSTVNTGSYNWTISASPSTTCLVRISQVGGSAADVSDAVFTIFSNPAGWTPVEGLQNNMIACGTAYKGNTLASVGDWLGAFGPGGVSDCRAVAAIGANGTYYLTVRSDASSGETITFKLFPLPSGPVIDASESIEFISDNVYADLPLHFGIRTQSFPLVAGWNWISFQVLPDNTALNSVFAAILGNVEQVKSQNKAALYSGGTWTGDLTNMAGIADGIMYKVKTSQTCTLNTNGFTIPFNTPLPLIKGWNWSAYLPSLPLPVETALDSIMTQLSQVKSQTQSAIKFGSVLTGDLTQMEPNKGYTIKMTGPGTLVYPHAVPLSPDQAAGAVTTASLADTNQLPWVPIKGNQYNMVAYGKVFLEGLAINSSGFYLVSVGTEGEGDCRSVSPIGTNGSYFSTILGNSNGENIKFKLYNSVSHKTYDIVESLVFQSDDLRSDYNVIARSVRITAPGGGENLIMGSVCVITWEAYNIDTIKIELFKSNKSVFTIASPVSAGLHTYSWTIPTRVSAGNDYTIKISSIDPGIIANDTSPAFSIVPTAGLTLNSPVGGEVWQVKRSYDITWGSSGINNIKIELYKGAVVNTEIIASTPAAPGKFTWTVPASQTPGNDYKIKITCLDAGINASDTSKSAFSITAHKTTAADFNSDSKADLVWRYYGTGGYNCIWLTAILPETMTIDDPRLDPQAVTIQDESDIQDKIVGTGDFNSDAKEDILWRNMSNGNNTVWFMNGTTYVSAASLPAESNLSWDICATGDFNNDGKVDIVWRNRTNGSNKAWLMNGTTRQSEVSLSSETNQAWDMVGAGDFDGDGKVDILWRNTTTGSNRVWIMNGITLVRTEVLPTASTDWQIVGAGDYDGNGKPDIFLRHKVDGRDTVWLMDGLSRHSALILTRVTNLDWKIEN